MGAALKADWESIRAEYEVCGKDSSVSALSRKWNISRGAIQEHIKKEGWIQNPSAAIQHATEAKLAGMSAGANPQKKIEAIEAEAQRRVELIQRHRADWLDADALRREAREARDFNLSKLAKINTEIISIIQAGERKAWGLDDKKEERSGTTVVNLISRIPGPEPYDDPE